MLALIDQIKDRMAQPLPGSPAQMKMAPLTRINPLTPPADARQSAVMVLLYQHQLVWHTLLMQRTIDGRTHSGQISFPGGKQEHTDKDLQETALRETEEEIGIKQEEIQILGQLSSLYIPPSNFQVTPVMGFLSGNLQTNVSPQEVQQLIAVPLTILFDDAIKEERLITTSTGLSLHSPVYILPDDHLVWGATAMIISELEHLLKPLFEKR